MLQIDHVYEFFYSTIFKGFSLYHCFNGVINTDTDQLTFSDIAVFTPESATTKKIFFYDQEPLLDKLTDRYFDMFNYPSGYSLEKISKLNNTKQLPYKLPQISQRELDFYIANPQYAYKQKTIVTSEKSVLADAYAAKYDTKLLYYFFHGFAALDWYRGFYALNYSKSINLPYKYDFVSYNRLLIDDRSYRLYFISLLAEHNLIQNNLISFGVAESNNHWIDELTNPATKLSKSAIDHILKYAPRQKLIVDNACVPGSASANIPRTLSVFQPNHTQPNVDAFWHIVTETVFYYDKLHLTEKIFKPIVSKQPFMLLAAPGNLAYLKSYGFKTFEGIIDESYDTIQDNDQRTEAVVRQIAWYCALTAEEKRAVIEAIAPIVEYNFHHFYGEFKHIITRELLDNCKTLFKEIGYDDNAIAYDDIYKVLTT